MNAPAGVEAWTGGEPPALYHTCMNYAEFQEQWENEADREYDRYMAMDSGALADLVRQGMFGEYYCIWRAIAAKCRLVDVQDAMMRVLRSERDYLVRYHCAAALIALSGAGSEGFEAVHLSARGRYDVEKRLSELVLFIAGRHGKT